MSDQEQEDLQADHEAGMHFGSPEPECWSCWDCEDEDGDNPECPGE